MKKIFFLIITSAVLMVACKKDIKVTGPDITILSPTSGEEFHSGDSLLLNFILHDPDMHTYSFEVIHTDTYDTLFSIPETHDHDTIINIYQKFELPTVLGHTPLRLRVHAADHSENTSVDSVDFHIMP